MTVPKRTLYQDKAILLNEELCQRYKDLAPREGTGAMLELLRHPSRVGGENDYRIDRGGSWHWESRFGREGADTQQYNPSFAVGNDLPED